MKTVELEDDVYEHLVQNIQDIGESASSILRRLLGMRACSDLQKSHVLRTNDDHELSAALTHPQFLVNSTAVDKFLYILQVAHEQQGSDFEKVLAITGRERTYFAKSKEEIEKTGTSTQPRKIFGSGYWAMTNSPTPQKRQLLRRVLRLLGYSPSAVTAAVATLR